MSDLTVKELKKMKEDLELEILGFLREKILDFRAASKVQTDEVYISHYDGFALPSDVTVAIEI